MFVWDQFFSSVGDLAYFSAWESLMFLRFQSMVKLKKAWPSPTKQSHKFFCGKLFTELGTCYSNEEVLILACSRLIISFVAKWLLCLPLCPLKCASFQLFSWNSSTLTYFVSTLTECKSHITCTAFILWFFHMFQSVPFRKKRFKIYLVIVTCWKFAAVLNLFYETKWGVYPTFRSY